MHKSHETNLISTYLIQFQTRHHAKTYAPEEEKQYQIVTKTNNLLENHTCLPQLL